MALMAVQAHMYLRPLGRGSDDAAITDCWLSFGCKMSAHLLVPVAVEEAERGVP